MTALPELKTIGRKDRLDLPGIGLENVEVKIDSGAYSCSIHCSSMRVEETADGAVLKVIFLDAEHPKYNGREFTFTDFWQKNVKASTGEAQLRYFIRLDILLFGEIVTADFSLTMRNNMRNPILVGRKILNKRFVIDTSKVNLSYRLKKQKKKQE